MKTSVLPMFLQAAMTLIRRNAFQGQGSQHLWSEILKPAAKLVCLAGQVILRAKESRTMAGHMHRDGISAWNQIRQEYEQNQEKALNLVRDMNSRQLNWHQDGHWSVAQCLAHCAETNKITGNSVITSLRSGPPGDRGAPGPRIPLFLEGFLLGIFNPPARVKAMAPKTITPVSAEYGLEVLQDYGTVSRKNSWMGNTGSFMICSSIHVRKAIMQILKGITTCPASP